MTNIRQALIILVATIVVSLYGEAAFAATLRVRVLSSSDDSPIEFASVGIFTVGKSYGKLTDQNGYAIFEVNYGTYDVTIGSTGYEGISVKNIKIAGDISLSYKLKPTTTLEEVVVTAKEGKDATSVSLIDRQAMEHLQPSSFTELTELLPGGKAKDPNMGSANLLRLREASNSSSSDNYNASSLGASFVVDGVPISANAEMQTSLDNNRTNRETVGKGVDMRAISTDDIESVEIIRGIASAQYGEVTSGVVNIKRKNTASRFEARFKADMQSQLFYVGKGFRMPSENWIMNISADYLNSRVDPRNTRENFRRVTTSIRSSKEWSDSTHTLNWNSSLNYSGIFERDKNDPDLTVNNTIDYFSSDKHNFSWNNTFVHRKKTKGFYRLSSLTAGISYATERINQEKTVSSSRVYPMPVSTVPGDHYVDFLPMVYDAKLLVDGKPFTFFSKVNSNFRYKIGSKIDNSLSVGAEWSTDKNFGRGQVYDPMRPIVAGNTSRPRAYSDVPALNRLSAYIENVSDLNIGENVFHISLGLRETQLVGLNSRYYLSGRPYFDPRINMKWTFPIVDVASNPLTFEIAGGIGQHTKMPVAAYLFPNKLYTDYTQLNYFTNDRDTRTINVKTFVEDLTNYDIKASRNFKWEIRGDISYLGNRLSVTYFREDMSNGFRKLGQVHIYKYNVYDASSYDPSTGRPPQIESLPSVPEERITVVGHHSNGSKSLKQGIEYTFSSRRFPIIRTRLTVNGAWFRTTLYNSQSQWIKPGVIINGKELQLAGLYNDRDGNIYESFNTNIMLDTDIPRLGLVFSISAQNVWFTLQKPLRKYGIPTDYIGTDGIIRPYTTADMEDVYLRHLVRTYSSTAFDTRRDPVQTDFNVKATKKLLKDRITIALYVNRLFSIAPDYERYGIVQRRYSSPYFGMELNLKL